MESIPKQKSQEEILDEGLAFALKLAQAENISDEEAVTAIAETIEKTMKSTGRPEFMERLDPGAFHSETKLISEKAKERLEKALNRFTDKFRDMYR